MIYFHLLNKKKKIFRKTAFVPKMKKTTTLDPIEFDYMDIFKISSIVLHRRQKLIQV